MPIFGNNLAAGHRFSPKKSTARRAQSLSNISNLDSRQIAHDFGIDYGRVNVTLDDEHLVFDRGNWVLESSSKHPPSGTGDAGVSNKEYNQLKHTNSSLRSENNLLKLKTEILIDMLSEHATELKLLEKELEEAKV